MTKTEARIRAEWDTLRSVVMHKAGVEMFSEILQSDESLEEDSPSQNSAVQEYEHLEHVLQQEFNVNIIRLRDTIVKAAEENPSIYDRLLQTADEAADITYDKEKDVHNPSELFDHLLLKPQTKTADKKKTKLLHLSTNEKKSLSEIYQMRDQQAVTDKGIFLSRLNIPLLRRESFIIKLLWEVLGIEVVHEVTEPGLFEGGDFIPVKDFAIVGVGNRTNMAGVQQLLKYGVGFDEIAVVHQPTYPLVPGEEVGQMVDMRLDNYFNIASKGVAVGLKPLLRTAQVDIYTKVSQGEYEMEKEHTDLLSYIAGWGFDVVGITVLEQLSNASNFLTIKDGTILAVEIERNIKDILYKLQIKAQGEPKQYEPLLREAEKDYEFLKNHSEFFPHKREMYQHGIDAYPLVLRNLTGIYGAAHCMTAALERR